MTETIAILNGGTVAESWVKSAFHPLIAPPIGHDGARQFAAGTLDVWPDFGAQNVDAE